MLDEFLRGVEETRSAAPCVAMVVRGAGSMVGCSIASDGYSNGDGLPNMDGPIGWYSTLGNAAAFTY